MTEWKEEISKRLANLNLEPTREAEIVEELSQHLEDSYQELLYTGISEAEARRLAGGPALPGDVVPLQEVQPALAPADPPPADRAGLASAGGMDSKETPAIPSSTGTACRPRRSSCPG